jgi:hypothetical protein
MSTETIPAEPPTEGTTEALDPSTIEASQAWGREAAEDFTAPAGHVDQPSTGAPVLAVAHSRSACPPHWHGTICRRAIDQLQ